MNENIMRTLGFGEMVDAVKKGICPLCGKKVIVDEFRDDISKREFKISGMCQSCQDKVFDPKEEY